MGRREETGFGPAVFFGEDSLTLHTRLEPETQLLEAWSLAAGGILIWGMGAPSGSSVTTSIKMTALGFSSSHCLAELGSLGPHSPPDSPPALVHPAQIH